MCVGSPMTPDVVIGGRSRSVGVGRGGETGHQEAIRETGTKVPPIKPVDKFLKVELTPGASAPVIGPINECFGETNNRVHPVKDDRRLRIVAEGDFMIGLMSMGSRSIDRRTVATPHALVFYATLEDIQDGVCLQVWHGVQKDMAWVPLAIETHTHDDRILIGTPAPFPRPMADATEIGIIQFHQSAQLIASITVLHGLLNFMVQEPGGIVP